MNFANEIRHILDCGPLDAATLERAFDTIVSGSADPMATAGLLTALASRPVERDALIAAARILRAHRVAIRPEVRPLVDTCGTGGDGAKTFNISTAAAFVVAAAGAAVAKHGNRGVSSPVGSADVLDAAGCKIQLDPRRAQRLLDATGFVFLFAPAFHPAMASVAPVRRALGVRTIFNLVGPLANPALADSQLVGVYDAGLTEVMAEALRGLGSRSALVVHCDGLDEIGLHAPTHGHRLVDGVVESFAFDPRSVGVERAPIEALRGADTAAESVVLLKRALSGEAALHADVVALNAGAALQVGGVVASIEDGYELARAKIDSGAALRVLQRYAASSQESSTEAVVG